jgi:signal transduction histidine kinase
VANQVVYGERVAPDEALRTFGSRLSRTIPLDELLLQMVESLRKSMSLTAAECWTGDGGRFEVAAAVPHHERPTLRLGEQELSVVSHVGVSGGSWLGIWLPDLVEPAKRSSTRVAPIVHLGKLLGLIVVTRTVGEDFTEEDDRVLTELARQVGLALHNAQLDLALQASFDELRRANTDLVESRRRIVSAGDAERRKLERNLHDGAQQYLVAMAVKLRLVEDLVEEEPDEALTIVGELRSNMQDAIAELRALAHGIFPPLLSSGGLAQALPAAATRAALPTTVDAETVDRYDPEVEASVYFCCIEALQNAGKHAGDGASVVVHLAEQDGMLHFEVVDDGAGFTVNGAAPAGHGFVNMTDRLGAIGGRLTVVSAPGEGTKVRGEIPIAHTNGSV